MSSKRELVSNTEKKPKNIELATKDKSAKSEKVQNKPIDPAEIEMQIGDDEDEESDDPQQVHMVESGEAYEESDEEDPVPASNISKKDASRGSASAQMQNLSGQNISANL